MVAQTLLWWGAQAYALLYGVAKSAGVNLRGLGWLLRRLRRDQVLRVGGARLHFDHRIAGSYDSLVAGRFNEPETALFLEAVLDALPDVATFVDVGANVGEFLITTAAHPRVGRAIGFEPHLLCAEACQRSVALNGFTHVTVHRALVGDGSMRRFATNRDNPNASAIGEVGQSVETVRLDDALSGVSAPTILLIDVEGAEPLVLSGATRFITRARPLIVFEHNVVSRARYNLQQVRDLLGPSYAIHRLRGDGRLDGKVEESWNCVAVPRSTAFESACSALLA